MVDYHRLNKRKFDIKRRMDRIAQLLLEIGNSELPSMHQAKEEVRIISEDLDMILMELEDNK